MTTDDNWLPGRRCWDAGWKAGRHQSLFPLEVGISLMWPSSLLPQAVVPGILWHLMPFRGSTCKQVWYRLQKGWSVHFYIEKFNVSMVSFWYETEASALIFEWKDSIWIWQRPTDAQTRLKAKHKADVQKFLIITKCAEIWLLQNFRKSSHKPMIYTSQELLSFEIWFLTQLMSCKPEIQRKFHFGNNYMQC